MNQKNNDDLPENGAEQEWMDIVKTAFFAVLLALSIRTTIAEPFNIPSGSMKPELQIGDYLFVSKYAYGYSKYSFPMGLGPFEGRIWTTEPKRGDIAVFKLPTDNKTDYIKRVIGLPGDTIQMREGFLYINGINAPRKKTGEFETVDQYGSVENMIEYEQTLPGDITIKIYENGDDGPLDNTRVFIVPEGHYFMMGDNRDNSQDSRVQNMVGFVPIENFVGRAEFLFFSTNGYARLWEFWKWPWTIRYDRILNIIQ